jgi:hypothetical protein
MSAMTTNTIAAAMGDFDAIPAAENNDRAASPMLVSLNIEDMRIALGLLGPR